MLSNRSVGNIGFDERPRPAGAHSDLRRGSVKGVGRRGLIDATTKPGAMRQFVLNRAADCAVAHPCYALANLSRECRQASGVSTTLELVYTGRNHSDSSLVMFLPKEKILFAVDFNSLGAVPSRLAINDSYPVEWEASLKRTLALDWERQIPGHPGPGGRLGTKKDMEQQLAFMTELSAEVKKAADAGKCFDPATKEVRLPQYATLQGYEQNIEWSTHRWCGYWGRGI